MTTTSTAEGADLGASPAEGGDRPFPWPWFAALAVAIYAAEVAWTWPTRMDFRGYYFGDPGANLVVQDLIRRGLRPTIDFVYQYGLLALLFGRGWFALLGDTPLAYRASGVAFGLWMIASLTRFVRAQRIGPAGAAILLVGLPFFVPSNQPNFTHGLESALLCQALAEQARGRRATALALATAAVLSKPSLGFVFGLILLVMTIASLRGRWSARTLLGAEGLGPAIATGVVLLAVLSAVYGVEPVVRTVIPTAGLANYRASHYGFFFGIGRMFWHPPGAGPGYYLGTVVGFWIVGTLTLLVAGLVSARSLIAARGWPRPGAAPAAELVATCAAAHAVFVSVLFGHAFTWPYDSFVLGVGLAALTRLGPGWRRWAWVLVALAAVGNRVNLTAPMAAWKGRASDAGIAGLWESPEARAEWGEVLDLTRGRRWALLAVSGSGELSAPGVDPPETFFLMPGMGDAPEIRRKASRLAEAEVVVVSKAFDNVALASWPEFAPILEGLGVAHDGPLYRVYRRRGPGATSPAPPGLRER